MCTGKSCLQGPLGQPVQTTGWIHYQEGCCLWPQLSSTLGCILAFPCLPGLPSSDVWHSLGCIHTGLLAALSHHLPNCLFDQSPQRWFSSSFLSLIHPHPLRVTSKSSLVFPSPHKDEVTILCLASLTLASMLRVGRHGVKSRGSRGWVLTGCSPQLSLSRWETRDKLTQFSAPGSLSIKWRS